MLIPLPLGLNMAVIPGGDKLLVKSHSTAHILARDMSSSTSFELPTGYGHIAASEEFVLCDSVQQ